MAIQQNTDHIQTTHIGSLTRPHKLLDILKAKYGSQPYLQALEGDVDTSHFGFLHAGHVDFVSDDRGRWQDAYAEQLTLASRPTPTTLRAVE